MTGQGGTATQLADNIPTQQWLDAAFRSKRLAPFVVAAPEADIWPAIVTFLEAGWH